MIKSGIDDWEAGQLVAALDECDGDLELLAKRIAPEASMQSIIMRAEFILAKSESTKHQLKWQQLINARNQARFTIAKQKAFEKIATYELPKDKDGIEVPVGLQTMLSYMRFWFGAESAGQQARARKEATSTAGSGEQSELEDLFEGLTGG